MSALMSRRRRLPNLTVVTGSMEWQRGVVHKMSGGPNSGDLDASHADALRRRRSSTGMSSSRKRLRRERGQGREHDLSDPLPRERATRDRAGSLDGDSSVRPAGQEGQEAPADNLEDNPVDSQGGLKKDNLKKVR